VLPPEHLTVVDGIAVTRVPRTLFDLAAVVHPLRAERAVDNCLASGTVSLAALGSVAAELSRKGRTGSALMRRFLEERGAGYVAPASELEARFLDLVRSAGLPEPVRQVDLGDLEHWIGRVDFAYPDVRVVIELDGRRWHDSKLDMESDQRRDQQLAAAGWRVVRVRWAQLVDEPDDVIRLLRSLIGPRTFPSGVTNNRPTMR
jgi:very-short-patch-repair endonuclease